jgi:excisionase family DNA binding protein
LSEKLLTSDEVAALLKATPRFVRRLVAQRRIEYVKVGRLVRFQESAVTDYVRRNRVVAMTRADIRRQFGGAA